MNVSIQTRATEPLRREHRELLPNVAQLAELADAVGVVPEDELWPRLEEAHGFLAHHLAPHARAEEAVLYPAVEHAMDAPGATATMTRDHVGIRAYVDELAGELDGRGPIDAARASRLRRLLYGLHAVVTLHFEKEEELYLETLDATLDAEAAEQLFRRLEAAAV